MCDTSSAQAGVSMNVVLKPLREITLKRTDMKSALGLSIMATASQCMKPMRSIWQSCNIIVGMATDELNLERNGKMNGMGLRLHRLCT